MKNTKKLVLFLLAVIIIPSIMLSNNANASSGACSDHDGVSCYIMDIDGSVICNDGWSDSTTYLFETEECNGLTIYDSLANLCTLAGIDTWADDFEVKYYEHLNEIMREYDSKQPGIGDPPEIFEYTQEDILECVDNYPYANQYTTYSSKLADCSTYMKDMYDNNLLKYNLWYDDYQFLQEQRDHYLQYSAHFDATMAAIGDVSKTCSLKSNSLFKDINTSHKNYIAIEWLYNHGIISGYPDNTFKPDNTINRAELLKILIMTSPYSEDLNAYGIADAEGKTCFDDVPYDEWYMPHICTAKKYGWIEGYPDGTFKPNQTVNKAEAIKMLLTTHLAKVPYLIDESPFEDVDVNDWYTPYLKIAKEKGLLEELSGNYYPSDDMTRASISESLYRYILNLYQDDIENRWFYEYLVNNTR